MKWAFLFPMIFLASCVSAQLAESNEEAVTALAQAAVTADPENVPLANEASATAASLIDATSWFEQLTHLGVPSVLIEKNADNVTKLSGKVDGADPKTKEAIEKARTSADGLQGRSTQRQMFMSAAKSAPLGEKIVNAAEAIGSAIALLYGGTRGRKHLARWWGTPTATVPPAPPPLPGDAPKTA